MSSYRVVASPPPRNPRASTGTVYVTSYDTSTSGHGGRNSTTTVPDSQNITYQALPIRKSTYPDGKTSKTEYAIRPRQSSAIPGEIRQPLSVSTINSSPPRRGSTLVASPRDVGSSSSRDLSSRYLQPSMVSPRSSTSHQRHNSTARAEPDDHSDRDRRDKIYTTHGSSGHRAHRSYHSSQSHQPRHQDEDGWSYTGPREQFDRDYPQQLAPRRDSQARRERPLNDHEYERAKSKRDYGPPSSSRQPDKSDRPDSSYRSSRAGADSDSDRYNDQTPRRQSLRAPVLHQHNLRRDDGYSSAREDRDGRNNRHSRDEKRGDNTRRREHDLDSARDRDRGSDRDRDRDFRHEYERGSRHDKDHDSGRNERAPEARHKPRSRDPSPERSDHKKLAAAALGGLATAGTIGALHKDARDQDAGHGASEDDDDHRRRRRRRRRTDDTPFKPDDSDEQRPAEVPRRRRHEGSGSDTLEDPIPKRAHSHGRRKDNRGDYGSKSGDTGESQARRPHRSNNDAEGNIRYESDHDRRLRDDSQPGARASTDVDLDRPSRELVLASQEDQTQDIVARTMSPGENEDDRPRRVQLVEPVKDSQEIKPKGILKPTRQVPFPEDPNPIREGVAPLKDAAKDGVPVNARWTKINRVLVNPEALEKYHERFEEREDYVIVLRVLSREEIQKLAEKTKEIREAREREWQRKLDNRKRDHDDDGSNASDYDDEEDEDRRPQLAIENGSTGQIADTTNFQQWPNSPQSQANARPARNRDTLANDEVSHNYSHNV